MSTAFPQTPAPARITLVDIMRVFAAYGVVVMHTTIQNGSPATSFYQNFFVFAVPFFLAVSFYFSKIPFGPPPSAASLRHRLWILFLPFVFWSLVYLAFRSAKYFAAHESSRVAELFYADPIALIFGGSAAVQLYFLPLLITGTCLQHLLAPFLCLRRRLLLWIALFLALAISYWVQLSPLSSFPTPAHSPGGMMIESLRYVLRYLLRCAPYIFAAALFKIHLESPAPSRFRKVTALVLLPFWFYILHASIPGLPGSLWEIFVGFYPLFLALAFKDSLKPSAFWQKLGLFAFGIYLAHHLVVEASEFIGAKILGAHALTGSMPAFALFTLGALILTALMVYIVDRWIPRLRTVFGLR